MGLIKVDGYSCERCSHVWAAKNSRIKARLPVVCPKCHSAYWNIKRRDRKNKGGNA
jgi:Zn finger protein HypA/HybF involved in hydrogenase expression